MTSDIMPNKKFDLRLHQRVIRPFISSTFDDMQQERDVLVKKVFPKLRKLCQQRRAVFTEIDLRWGITTEQVAEKKVLELCFEEIDRSLPYFIGVLGERYGSMVDLASIPPHLFESHGWLKEFSRASVTELEIQHAVLQKRLMHGHAWFYFRDPEFIEQTPREEQLKLRETNTESFNSLQELKSKIRKAGADGFCMLRENYQTPEQLGEWVLEDFSRLVDELYPLNELPDQLQQESLNHETYAESLRFAFIGRVEVLHLLNAKAAEVRQPVVLTGDPGCGKSALLAKWVFQWRLDHEDDHIIQHYVRGTSQGGTWQETVHHIIAEVNYISGVKRNIPVKEIGLMSALEECLDDIPNPQRIVLILDGIDQLAHDSYGLQLEWLPRFFHENFMVFISCGDGEALSVLRHRGYEIITVPLFTRQEVIQAIDEFFKLYGNRRLPVDVTKEISSVESVRSPLFLRAILDELRQLGNIDELPGKAHDYFSSEDLEDLFCRIIKRWEHDFGNSPGAPDLVRRSLCLLTCSRLGLSESELSELLGNDSAPLPRHFWTPLFLAAESFLSMNSGLLNINHRFLRKAISRLWGVTSPQEISSPQWATQMFSSQEFHHQLAGYFEKQAISVRKVKELPWQYQEGRDWQPFFDLLDEWSRNPRVEIDMNEIRFHWQRAELEIREINRRFLNIPSLFQRLLAKCLFHRTMEHMGEHKYHLAIVVIDEAIALLKMKEDDKGANEDRAKRLVTALSIKTGLMVGIHRFDKADELLAEQQQISEEFHDEIGMAVVQRLRITVEEDKAAWEQSLNTKTKKL